MASTTKRPPAAAVRSTHSCILSTKRPTAASRSPSAGAFPRTRPTISGASSAAACSASSTMRSTARARPAWSGSVRERPSSRNARPLLSAARRRPASRRRSSSSRRRSSAGERMLISMPSKPSSRDTRAASRTRPGNSIGPKPVGPDAVAKHAGQLMPGCGVVYWTWWFAARSVLSDPWQREDRLPALAERLAQEGLHIGDCPECGLLDRRNGAGREGRQDVVDDHGEVLAEGRHRSLGLPRLGVRRLADDALRRAEELDGEMLFGLRPALRTMVAVDRVVEVAWRHVLLGLGLDRLRHVDHLGEQRQPQRGLRLVGVDERRVPPTALLGGAEEVLDRAVPVDDADDGGNLVALEELVQSRLEHPQLAVVVDDDHLTEAVVPQTEHDVDKRLLHHRLAQHDRAGHADVMVGMTAIHAVSYTHLTLPTILRV